jgi:hypothetical protein
MIAPGSSGVEKKSEDSDGKSLNGAAIVTLLHEAKKGRGVLAAPREAGDKKYVLAVRRRA